MAVSGAGRKPVVNCFSQVVWYMTLSCIIPNGCRARRWSCFSLTVVLSVSLLLRAMLEIAADAGGGRPGVPFPFICLSAITLSPSASKTAAFSGAIEFELDSLVKEFDV